jgi:hypothetical protein
MIRSVAVFELGEQDGYMCLGDFDLACLLLDAVEDHFDVELAFPRIRDVLVQSRRPVRLGMFCLGVRSKHLRTVMSSGSSECRVT